MIRAKMKCMSVKKNWDGTGVVELMPVYAKSGGNYPENMTFWQYTPSGEVQIGIPAGADCPYVPNRLYFVDMEPSATGKWVLNLTTLWRERSGTVEFNGDTHLDRVKLNLSGGSACPQDFGKPGFAWSITFTPAPDSET